MVQSILFCFFVFFVFFVCTLSKDHAHEWRRHRCSYLSISVSFLFAVIAEMALLFVLFWYVFFNFNASTAKDHKAPFQGDLFAFFWLIVVLLNIVELIPVIAFLAKNQLLHPHDCFTCWNKDPDRKYSIHQYSKDDWKQILFLRRPLADRAREARALTQFIEQQNPENVPSEAATSMVKLRVNNSKSKADALIEEMASDHKILSKYHTMFSNKDVEELGGGYSDSVLKQ